MTTKKRTRNTAGSESEQSDAVRKNYLKAMSAAVRYVAAVQDSRPRRSRQSHS